MEDSPEAKKEASELESPAWLKSVGAYLAEGQQLHCIVNQFTALTYKTPSMPESCTIPRMNRARVVLLR